MNSNFQKMHVFLKEHIPEKKNFLRKINLDRCRSMENDKLLDGFYTVFKSLYKPTVVKNYEGYEGSNFISFSYQKEIFEVNIYDLINVFHFYKANEVRTLNEMKSYFEKEIFLCKETNKIRKSHAYWISNFNSNLKTLQDLLGTVFIDLLRELFPQVAQIERDHGEFHPSLQFVIEALETMTRKIKEAHDDGKLFCFGPTGFVEIIQKYSEYRLTKRNEDDILHLPSFVSFVLVFVDLYVVSCSHASKALGLFGLFDAKREPPSYTDILKLAYKERLQPEEMKREDLIILLSRDSMAEIKSPSDSEKTWSGFENSLSFSYHNPLELEQNKTFIQRYKHCHPALKKCIVQEDAKKIKSELEKLANAIRFSSEGIVGIEEKMTRFIDWQCGYYSEYECREGVDFLVGVFPIQIEKFMEWVAKNILFSPDHLVNKFKNFEAAAVEYAKDTKTALDYRKNKGHENCLTWCGEKGCRKQDLTEYQLHLVILRFLREKPVMKSPSTLAAHLAKHGGGNERIELLRGELKDLKKFYPHYFSILTKLISPEPHDDNSKWCDTELKKYKYRFTRSGNISVTIGNWDGQNKAMMCYLTITDNNEIYVKSLINDYPKDEQQAKVFKWHGKMWTVHKERMKKKNWKHFKPYS